MEGHEKRQVIGIETKTILQVILFGLAIFLLIRLSDLVLILLTSIVLASFIESIVAKFSRYNIPRSLVVIIVYIVSIAAIVGLFYLFVPVFVTELSSLLDSATATGDQGILGGLSHSTLSSTRDFLSTLSGGFSASEFFYSVQDLVSGVSGGFFDTANYFFGGITNLILVAVVTFYLSIEPHGVEYVLRIITPIKYESYVIGLWKRTERKIGLWLQGQILLGLIVGLLVYLGLILLNVQYSLLLALIAAVLEIIPFGIILAGLCAMAFSYVDAGIIGAFKVFILYTVVQQFESYFLAPLIVKKVIGITPLVVILSVLAGAELAGFWGVILAVPVSVCLLEYIGDVEKGRAETVIE
jgi:predicted PurR-regulated permease PerM